MNLRKAITAIGFLYTIFYVCVSIKDIEEEKELGPLE